MYSELPPWRCHGNHVIYEKPSFGRLLYTIYIANHYKDRGAIQLVSRSQTLIPTGKGLARRVKKTGLASRDYNSVGGFWWLCGLYAADVPGFESRRILVFFFFTMNLVVFFFYRRV